MVMIFGSKKAREYLLKNGVVYSFRSKQRKDTGKNWITDKRGGKKLNNVEIEEVGSMSMYLLGDYVYASGFQTLIEWIEEIKKVNKRIVDPFGWLYKVTLTKTE
jgi:hypothetical protein